MGMGPIRRAGYAVPGYMNSVPGRAGRRPWRRSVA